ncbi:MAG: PAS domain S-box protein [Gemmatimonadetes bacterium]|nr:PAS domain S-box protein [Gemmatimonadota bacterium]
MRIDLAGPLGVRDVTRRRLLRWVGLGIVVGEALAMLLLQLLPPMPWWLATLFDTLFLAGTVAVLLFVLVRPRLTRHLDQHHLLTVEAMRDSVAHYHEAFEGNPHPMWFYDAETLRFLDVNEAAVQRYGYSREEFAQRTIADIRPPEDLPDLQRMVETSKSRKGLTQHFSRHLTKAGELLDIEITSQAVTHRGRPARLVVARNVTEMQQAAAAIEHANRRLAYFIDQMPVGVIEWDTDLRVVGWNPAAERIFGYTAAEAHGQHAFFLVPEPLRAELGRTIEQLANARESMTLVNENVRSDGKVITCAWSNTPLVDARGRRFGVTSQVSDITEQGRAEAALRASEARYRALAESAQDAIVTVDAQRRIVGWTGGAAAIFGYTAEEVMGKPLDPIIPDRMHDAHRAGFTRAVAVREHPVSGDVVRVTGRRKSGVEFPVELSLARWESTEGQFLTGIIRDVSGRETEERLRRMQGAALNAAPNPMIILDREGRIEWVNAAFSRTTGLALTEVLGEELVQRLSPERAARVGDAIRSAIRAGRHWSGEVESRRRDGTAFPAFLAITPVQDATGAVEHVIAVGRDLTEEKARHAQFLQAQKMESVGQLAGGVAHDFNNLLSVINGSADLIIDDLPASDPVYADVQAIRQAAQRAAALTKQLLSFSRRNLERIEPVRVGALIEGMIPMLRRLIGEHVEVVVDTSASSNTVMADASQLEQVVMNLAVNARDAMPTGGTLRVRVQDVEFDTDAAAAAPALRAGRHVRLEVEDNGQGMDDATRQRVFEPFFTTKARGFGTGLGMATVYGIVKSARGAIDVASQRGRGTTFTILLPCTSATAVERPAVATVSATGTETVLFVEDDSSLLRLGCRVLRAAGYVVLEARHGAEALQVAASAKREIDILVTDVVMPVMDGRALAEQMLATRSSLKVLYTSGYTDDEILRHGIGRGTVQLLSKPYLPRALTQAVRAVLDGRTIENAQG